MRILLDTQLYLWYLADSRKLTREARTAIEDADHVFVSAASIWEAAIKIGIGKLSAPLDGLADGIGASGFLELPVTARHSARVGTLAAHHRDPFDRMLVAQALCEPLQLLTADLALRPYSELVRIV